MNKTYRKALLLIAMMGVYVSAFAQIQTPRPSPEGKVYSKVGLTDVTVDYFRPKAKGRKIFGAGEGFVAPYGQIWRSGANNGTKLTISGELDVMGTKVPAGEYLIFTIPGASEWTVMLYKDLSIGGNTAAYDKTKEAGRFIVKPGKLTEKVETLTFNISDISDDNKTANLELAWENTSVKLPLKADFDAQVMRAIVGNYLVAANYYFETGRDLNQAIQWMDMYLAEGKNSEQFWNVHQKAKMLKAKGDKAAALAAAQMSLDLAKKAPSDFGYIKLNEELIASLK